MTDTTRNRNLKAIEDQTCPRCKQGMARPFMALSRSDNTTYVCSPCGSDEAIWQYTVNEPLKPLDRPVW